MADDDRVMELIEENTQVGEFDSSSRSISR